MINVISDEPKEPTGRRIGDSRVASATGAPNQPASSDAPLGTITRSFRNPPRRENGSLPRNVCSNGGGAETQAELGGVGPVFVGYRHVNFGLTL